MESGFAKFDCVQATVSYHVRMRFLRVLSILGLLALSGCASVSYDGSYQTIRVQTEPPGASVRVDGAVVGHTPLFTEVRRSLHPKIEVASQDEPTGFRTVELATKYRFKRSFLGGLLTFSLAPYAWALDVLTGNAWDVRDMDLVKVSLRDSDREWLTSEKTRVQQRPRLALAPPQTDSILVSDQAADELEGVLKRKGEEVSPYHSTLPIFLKNDYEFDEVPDDLRSLYRELSVDGVVASKVTNKGPVRQVQAEFIDLKTPNLERRPGPIFEFVAKDPRPAILANLGTWARLIPNTVGLDFSTENMSIVLGGMAYDLTPIDPEEWWGKGAQYVSAISISNTPPIRHGVGGRGSINAVPMLRFSRKNIRANNLPPPASGELVERSPTFQRISASGGYGVEFGYQVDSHYVYLDLIPFIRWSEITWRQNSKTESATRFGIATQVEIGYSYFFVNGMLLKIFSRSQPEDTENWRDAFRARVNSWDLPIYAATSVSGLVVAYRFQ